MSSILVDTSRFVDFLRGVDSHSLPPLILSGRVILSAVVKLELLAGVRKSESKALESLLSGLVQIETFAPVAQCQRLLVRARGSGLLGGLPDLMILADCERTQSALFSSDGKLIKLAQALKIPLYLAHEARR